MLSIIISSRCDTYLQKTVDDLFSKAEGDVEVIVVLDGIWSVLKDDPRLTIIHQGEVHANLGMRAAINAGVAISKGEYIMKVDEHTLMDQGYDLKLIADCQEDTLVIPRRYRLDADEWKVIEDGRPPIDYMIIDYPYQRPYDKTCGMHGAEHKRPDRESILIDDVMTGQGSCWFLPRKLWDSAVGKMDEEGYGTFTQEAQELTNKIWLSGGRCIVNKKTWYAHLHKGKKGKGYGFSNQQYKNHMESMEKGRLYCINYWLYTKDYPRDFDWLVNHFWPLPGWPENWREQVEIDKLKDYSTLKYKDDYWLEGLR